MTAPPVILIYDLEDATAAARAAVAARVAVTLRTAPGAASHAGVGWFRALTEAVRADVPEATPENVALVLDCADAAGRAMEAIREGVEAIRFTGAPEVAAKIAAMCVDAGIGFDDGATSGAERIVDLRDADDAEAAVRGFLT